MNPKCKHYGQKKFSIPNDLECEYLDEYRGLSPYQARVIQKLIRHENRIERSDKRHIGFQYATIQGQEHTYKKGTKFIPGLDNLPVSWESSVEEIVLENLRLGMIHRVLREVWPLLTKTERTVLKLYHKGIRFKDIADKLGKGKQAISNIFARMPRRIKRKYKLTQGEYDFMFN